jgi:hypothetical protein
MVFKGEDKLPAWKDNFDNDVVIRGDQLLQAGGAALCIVAAFPLGG